MADSKKTQSVKRHILIIGYADSSLLKSFRYECEKFFEVSLLASDGKVFSPAELALLVTTGPYDFVFNLLFADPKNFGFEPRSVSAVIEAISHGLYGTAKAAVHIVPKAEFILKNLQNTVIFEVQQILTANGENFVTNLLTSLLRHRKVKIFSSEISVPISSRLLAKVSVSAARKIPYIYKWEGTYKLGSTGPFSCLDAAELTRSEAMRLRPDLKWGTIRLVEDDSEEVRANYDFGPFQDKFEMVLPDWRDSVIETVFGFVSGLKEEPDGSS